MIRALLIAVLMMLVARAFWQVVDGIIASLGSSEPPARRGGGDGSVKLVRDPVCGTYVSPRTAISRSDGARTYYFCSEQCRAKFSKRA